MKRRLPSIQARRPFNLITFQIFFAKSIVLAILVFSRIAVAGETAQTVTLDGRLFDSLSSDSPLLDPKVFFNVKILNPDKTCVLYEENQTADTTLNPGRFTIHIGSAVGSSKRVSMEPGNSMARVFQNTLPITGTGATCGGVYAPSPGDVRYMRITVSPSVSMTAEVLGPDTLVESVPTAMVAETLQGFRPSQFLILGNESLTQTDVESVFSDANFPRLTSLIGGSSTDYVRVSAGSATIPTRSGAPASPAVGQMWYNTATNSMQYYASGGVQTVGVGGYDASYARVNGNSFGSAFSLGSNDAFGLSFRTNNVVHMTITSSGLIGIGTEIPSVALDVAGAVRVGTEFTSCSSNLSGSLRSNGNVIEFCNGTSWSALASAAGSIASLGGLTATTQLFTTGTGGTAPIWTTTGLDTQVLNIPMASLAGVTAGLISNAQYEAKLSSALAAGNIFLGSPSGVAMAVLPSGDISLSGMGLFGVEKFRGIALDTLLPNLSGQVLRFDSSGAGKWTPALLSMADIRSTATNATIFPSANCPLSQTMTWSSLTDSFVCQNIQISSTQIVYASAPTNLVFAGPASGAVASPTFRSLVAADLPAGLYDQTYFKQNGNSFGAAAVLGTNDANTLSFTTNSVNRMLIDGEGLIGIGTLTPHALLDLEGTTTANSALIVPRATLANRPIVPVNGMIRYNTDLSALEAFTNGAWQTFATGGHGASQWVSSGANIFYSSGKVGVGTNSPLFDLDVGGTIGFYGTGATLTGSPTGSLNLNSLGGGFALRYVGADRISVNNNVSLTSQAANEISINNGSTRTLTAMSGKIGVGTTTIAAGAVADFAGLGTGGSAVILPRDTLSSRPAGVNGMIRYNNQSDKFEAYEGSTWKDMISSGATNPSLSAITDAVSTKTLANASFTQTWNWDAITTQSGLSLNSNSLTTGSVLNVAGSFNSATSTGPVAKISSLGTLNASVTLMVSNAGTGSSFRVNDDGSDADPTPFVIDASGSVGIGTATPSAKLSIMGALNTSGDITVGSSAGLYSNNSYLAKIFNSSQNPAAPGYTFTYSSDTGMYEAGSAGSHALGFSTSGTERLRILSGGKVGIGTNNPAYALDVVGDINASGNVRAAGVALTSDIRFKKNIQNIDDALAKILKLRGVRYDWRSDIFPERHFTSRGQIGIIAQEVEAQFPELVDTNEDGYKAVNYPALISPLIEALKSIYGICESHQTVVEKLESRIRALERANSNLHLESAAMRNESQLLREENQSVRAYLCAKDASAAFCR